MQIPAPTSNGTGSSDYGEAYYKAHLGLENYDWTDNHWHGFFTRVASRIVALGGVQSSYDVGCAKGLLVQALAELGVDAHGSDISSWAVENSHPDVRSRLKVANAITPLDGRWDLITCIEVLEHMSQNDAELAIDNMTAATDRILFSSSPGDFTEASHINVRTPAEWAASFAERGFYRRTDIDASFLIPWAVVFTRDDLNVRDLVYRYEDYTHPLRMEVIEKRQALLETERRLTEQPAIAADEQTRLQNTITELEHRLMIARDHAVGAEASIATAQRERKEATQERDLVLAELAAVKASQRWRAGGVVATPVATLKRMRRA